jgi:hypothetical protein
MGVDNNSKQLDNTYHSQAYFRTASVTCGAAEQLEQHSVLTIHLPYGL